MKPKFKQMKLTDGSTFKQFFMSNDQVLMALLKSFLPIDEDILDIQFIHPKKVENGEKSSSTTPEQTPEEYFEDNAFLTEVQSCKEAGLDLNVLLSNEEHVNVEMQMISDPDLLDKIILYSPKSCDELTTTYSLIFTTFLIFEDAPDDYSKEFIIRQRNDPSAPYKEYRRVILVEMSGLNKKCSELTTLKDKLYYLLMHAHKLTPEERAHLSKTEEMKIALEHLDKME